MVQNVPFVPSKSEHSFVIRRAPLRAEDADVVAAASEADDGCTDAARIALGPLVRLCYRVCADLNTALSCSSLMSSQST